MLRDRSAQSAKQAVATMVIKQKMKIFDLEKQLEELSEMLEKEINANETLKEAVKGQEEKINDYEAIYCDNKEERRKLIEDLKAAEEIKGQC